MKKGKRLLFSLLCFAIILSFIIPISPPAKASPSTIYVPDDYSTIQAAVDAASPGDTIIVRDGTYIENVDVNKSLILQSENGAEATIVEASNSIDYVFHISADEVYISGFKLGRGSAGIYLDNADYCEISNNVLASNNYGISTRTYWSSSNNIIVDNIVENNDRGIFISYASSGNSIIGNISQNNNVGIFLAGGNNAITDNTIQNNTRGILLSYSDGNNTLTNNIMSGNIYNFNVTGFDLGQYLHNIDPSNKVDGKPIYYLVGQQNKQILSDAGYVAIVDSTNITVRGLTLTNNGDGILLAYSTNSKVENVIATGNYYGFRLHRSSNNTITNSRASNSHHGVFLYYASPGVPSSTNNIVTSNNASNNEHGITIWDYASDNTIVSNNIYNNNFGAYIGSFAGENHVYLNNFLGNIDNVRKSSGVSKISWNSHEKTTYTYNDKVYANYLGNYWNDYVGSDPDGDGIGDTAYSIDGDNDNYPLKEPFENYGIGPPTLAGKVCIDAGHSPTDLNPDKRVEYTINKAVADKLKPKFEAKGIAVYLTNPSDDITGRVTHVNNTLEPDIFVSLHCNALEGFVNGTPIGTARGSEVWIYNDMDSSKQAINEHSLAVCSLNGLSEEIGSEARQPIPKEIQSPWPQGIPILRGVTVCPAVLLEMEFFDYGDLVTYKGVTYQNMLELMSTDIWLEDAAQGIANGILQYFAENSTLTITTHSPVDIVVTDPDGLTISKQLNEIPGATYIETDIDGDGDIDDQVTIPNKKIGDYIIKVLPDSDALPTDMYTLEVSIFGTPIILADNVQISDIPSEPYIIESTSTGIVLPLIEADLVGRSAWPEHHHFVLSKDGKDDVEDKHGSAGAQTLYGKVGNTGNLTLPAETYKVIWEIVDSENITVGIYETDGNEPLKTGDTVVLTHDIVVSEQDWFVEGKYTVTAQCCYYDIEGEKLKEFSFAVVE